MRKKVAKVVPQNEDNATLQTLLYPNKSAFNFHSLFLFKSDDILVWD